ncbi:response regulator [Silvibacterium acidisoli]|uniref:response regulator n=1 Tax=Acidobacteriaceae bacterium ZG23-2 TaxID=2883246 RepID=UPI00406C9690
MIRPCFLVVDREFSGTISSRKLVIETAKFNVITAYSGAEALETLAKFPAVDGVVINSGLRDIPCTEVIARMKVQQPGLRVVVVESAGDGPCHGGDYAVDSFKPEDLLLVLRKMEPEKDEIIQEHEKELGD